MAEQARPVQAAAEEPAEKQPDGQKPVGFLGRLLSRKWLLILLALWIGYRLDKRLIPQVDQG